MNTKKNVLIVDDHLVVRKGLRLTLSERFPNFSVYDVDSYASLLDQCTKYDFDLILLDVNINGVENVKIMNEVKAVLPDVKILIFTSHDEKQYGLRYIENGADGFLNKFCSEEKLEYAIKHVFETGYYYSDAIREKIRNSGRKKTAENPLDLLSNREFEIAKLLVDGEGNLEISNKLDIKMSTVSTYKNRIFEKLKVNSVVALAEIFKNSN